MMFVVFLRFFSLVFYALVMRRLPCHAKSIMLSRTHLVLDSFLMLIASVYLYSYYAVRIDAQWTWAHQEMLHCEWKKKLLHVWTRWAQNNSHNEKLKRMSCLLFAVYTNWPNKFQPFSNGIEMRRRENSQSFFSLMPQAHTYTDELCKITQRRCNRYSSGAVSPFFILSFYIFSKRNSTHKTPIIVCMS